ncbi:FHIPEP family type III secretion protein [Streptomyces melanogenes]|uniref:FHIPEP family type III secretion protein n=1 Tax=Streptomyces melanogenes TaxID=67326 RepID=UPI00167DA12E|nr:FHIPEP family type III secretion protein [Streptomyces melanogenes]
MTLAPPVFDAADAAVRRRVGAELSGPAAELGIPGAPFVHFVRGDADGSAVPPVRVSADGRRCHVPDTAIGQALSYVDGSPLVGTRTDSAALLGSGAGADASRLGELLALVCRGALLARPASYDEATESEQTIDILIDPVYLRDLTAEPTATDLFSLLREGLFTELGLVLPPFHAHLDPSLREGGFAFRVQGMRTPPRIGLTKGTVLVDGTVERLALMNVTAQATTLPETGLPAAVVTAEHGEILEAAGLTTWDPLKYLVLSLTGTLRSQAHALLTPNVAARMLDDLGSVFPLVADAARSHLPPSLLMAVLRGLLQDGVSIRDLRRIVELMLRHVMEREPSPDPDDCVAFVRAGLADHIASKAACGSGTIIAFLLSQELEDAVAKELRAPASDRSEEVADRLSAALEAQLAYRSPAAPLPVVLTQDDRRVPVRTVLRHRLPRLTVLSYSDIPPYYNIQPIARVS